MEEQMGQDYTARVQGDESRGRPVAEVRHGGIKLAVWANKGVSGTMYNTTISKSYEDDKTGEWKETTSFSPTDLLVVGVWLANIPSDKNHLT